MTLNDVFTLLGLLVLMISTLWVMGSMQYLASTTDIAMWKAWIVAFVPALLLVLAYIWFIHSGILQIAWSIGMLLWW